MLLLAAGSACVFPADVPTGIEFSWLFVEGEPSDGDDALRVLTCSGARVDTLAATIEDADDPTRRGTFRFPCADGFQTADELARRASEAFLELDEGEYEVTLRSEQPDGPSERLASRTVDVLGRAVTLELWEFTMAPVAWSLQLGNADQCAEFSLALYYADPQAALGEATLDDDGEPVSVLYRTALVSDRGLGVAGDPGACADVAGLHRFVGMDRGTYRLEVTVDGTRCAIEVDLGADATTTVDLGALPCG